MDLNQKCEASLSEDDDKHGSPVAKRWRLESDKLENDSKHSGTNEMEEEEAVRTTSPEEFIEKDSIRNKSENVDCKHSETTEKEQEEAMCSLPEEFIGKENKKDDSEEIDQQKNKTCQYEFGQATCQCVEEFKRKECEKKIDTILLPSSVTDKEEIFFPHNISNEDPTIYGKWLIFTNGNLKLQNHIWIQLQNLVENKHLVLIASSTAKMCENRDSFQGVIKCYTSKDINVIRRAGLLIQNVLKDDCIIDYKTNEASQKNFFRATGKRFIAKFMLTVNGKLYRRDKLCRWIQITDAEYENFMFDEKLSENVTPFTKRQQQSESNLLPSLETRKKKICYAYPEKAYKNNSSLLLCLFCNVDDPDANGLTELDRAWNEAKALRDEQLFKSVFCETYAFHNPSKGTNPRRTVMCEMYDHGVDFVIKCADKLREKVSYNSPVYYKFFCYTRYKPDYKLKYLYTEDRELYEYTEAKWKLLKRV